MKKIFIFVFLCFFAVSCAGWKDRCVETTQECHPKPKEPIVLKGVNFEYNKAVIKPESFPILNENVDLLKSKPRVTITVIGHTDSDGKDAYNQKLSDARANAVMQYFLDHGISADRMKAIGKGESAPIADNKTDAGKAQNRRIELEFTDPDDNNVEMICREIKK